MSASPSVVERTGDERRPENDYPPARREVTRVQIVSRPFSLRTFALWGLALFVTAFLCGRYLEQLDAAPGISVPEVATTAAATPAAAASTPGAEQPNMPKVVTVTIRLMKFSPEQIEIKAGDTVEWKNADLTPHTATAPTKEFDSGPINPTAVWRQTFAKPGTLPYVCTFHPDMHGVVVVK
jgi:plastocyanin